ncbi:MAG: NUDIX hydrolase [Rhizobiaceae bacterium]|nr:NUDIX hydrolase [Rhizobiaceae bacterium]MCV0408070.1 NUDIX hydrolase [Rhizobiaceae bacterium]
MDGIRIVTAVSVALVRDRQVLLVRRARPPAQGLYAFPGGRVEPEETLEQAARRELLEETGLTAGPLARFQQIDIEAEPEGEPVAFRLTVFTGEPRDGEPVAGDDADTVEWFELDELAALPLTDPTMRAALEILAMR